MERIDNVGEFYDKCQLESLALSVEKTYGRRFNSTVNGVARVGDSSGSLLEAGGIGTIDYGKRLVIIDENKALAHGREIKELIKHEFVHILERDNLHGCFPVHYHIVHASFSEDERRILLDRSEIFGDQFTQKDCFGESFRC